LKNLLLILGNGFSIDFIEHIAKEKEVDVKNLFRLGHTVRFPAATHGFLSYQYCPNLWLLGARPNISSSESMSIIEEIITCSNMLFDYLKYDGDDRNRVKLIEPDNQSVYIKAYSELITYLRHLFISYNNQITDDEIKDFIGHNNWGWISFFKEMLKKYDSINIVTYNYDIWLERIPTSLSLDFSICGCEKECKKISVVKPHGSISFVPKIEQNPLYQISYSIDSSDMEMGNLNIEYSDLEKYSKSYLIPPAGDSSRQKISAWSKTLRECAILSAKDLKERDDTIICGMSYWHVDRKELDELLINLNQSINLTLINPNLPKDLNAVLVTLFKNYTVFTSSELLKEVIQ
jgi:hypothetical protein